MEPDVPEWIPAWCHRHLGHGPVEVLFRLDQMSSVLGLRLGDGAEVVVKARPDEGREAACVAAQARLAERGFPCARPLTAVVQVGALAVHAEDFRPGGEELGGDSPDVAARYAEVFAQLAGALRELSVPPPLPNPRWVRWDHTDPGLWPAITLLDEQDRGQVPPFVVEAAERSRARLLATDLPQVLGHADFEAQNLRWRDGAVWTVHDWDSLARQPEAALAGAASGAFPRVAGAAPVLPPIESSEAFLTTYVRARARPISAEEWQVAWASSVWTAAHHARWEILMSRAPVAGDALRAQAAERLRRARA